MKSGPKLMNLQSDINSLGKILADRSEFENDVIPEVEVNNEILVNVSSNIIKKIKNFNKPKSNFLNILDRIEENTITTRKSKKSTSTKFNWKNFFKTVSVFQLINKTKDLLIIRSKLRKPDKLESIHYNLIGDPTYINEKEKYIEKNDRRKNLIKILFIFLLGKFSSMISNIPILKPNSFFRILWDFLLFILIYLLFFIISIENSFNINFNQISNGFKIDPNMIFVTFFFLNILINFNTSFYEYGVLVTHRKKIIISYLKNNFIVDIVSLISLIFYEFSEEESNLKYIRLLFFLNISNLNRIYKNIEQMYRIPDIFELFFILFKTICVAHILGCLWFLIGKVGQSNSSSSWLQEKNLINKDWQEKYISSIYWAFTTMCTVGYGDIVPQNNLEKVYCSLTMVVSTLMFGYSVNNIGIIINRNEEKKKEFRQNFKIIDKYLERNNLGIDLKIKVKKYLEFIWTAAQQNYDKEEEILQKLPPYLKKEILLETNGKILKSLTLLKYNFSNDFIEKISLDLRPIRYSPAEIIYEEGIFEEPFLFILVEGEIDLIHREKESNIHLKTLKVGDCFNESSFFDGNYFRETAITKSHVGIFKISKSKFIEILSSLPEDYETYCMIRDKINIDKKSITIFSQCYSCKKYDHNYQLCPLLKFIPNKIITISKYKYSLQQKRNPFNRRLKKNHNSLIDKNLNSKIAMNLRFDKNFLTSYEKNTDKTLSKTIFKIETQEKEMSIINWYPSKSLDFNTKKIKRNEIIIGKKRSKSVNIRYFNEINLSINHGKTLGKKNNDKKHFFHDNTSKISDLKTKKTINDNLTIKFEKGKSNEIEFSEKKEIIDLDFVENFNMIRNKQNVITSVEFSPFHNKIKNDIIFLDFDKKNKFKKFFPHNNYDKIIEKINFKSAKKINELKKNKLKRIKTKYGNKNLIKFKK